jgi:hypothetical protein
MRQTFEDLIFELEGQSDGWSTTYNFTDVLKLLKLVREKTLEECKNISSINHDAAAVYNDILELDKDSIEI